jgi:hypothetical protein
MPDLLVPAELKGQPYGYDIVYLNETKLGEPLVRLNILL